MNIKDPLNPYKDTRLVDKRKKEKEASTQKIVYKSNYELVTGHPSLSIPGTGASSRISVSTRTTGASLNGRAL